MCQKLEETKYIFLIINHSITYTKALLEYLFMYVHIYTKSWARNGDAHNKCFFCSLLFLLIFRERGRNRERETLIDSWLCPDQGLKP